MYVVIEPNLRFLSLGIALTEEEKGVLDNIHSALDRLTRRRKDHISLSKFFAEAVLREALLYRVVAAARGVIVSWNSGNVLCSFLAARALFETFAYLWDYRRAINGARTSEDLEDFDDLTFKRLVSTRNPKWIEQNPEWEATNIVTIVKRLSEEYPGLGKAYDEMSYRCHPNTEGVFYMFADLDGDEKTVTFSDHNENAGWAFRLVIAVAGLTIEAEQIFDWLENETPKIADELSKKKFMKATSKSAQDNQLFMRFVRDEREALMGGADGQFSVGSFWAKGLAGLPKDLIRAYMWFSLSAARGNEKASRSRDKIARNMTPAQIAEAQALANEWKPITPQQIDEIEEYWRNYRWPPSVVASGT